MLFIAFGVCGLLIVHVYLFVSFYLICALVFVVVVVSLLCLTASFNSYKALFLSR